MGHLVGPAYGQEHVAGVQRPGGAGRARGSADARLIEKQQQTLALDALEAEVHVAREPVRPVPVEGAVGDGAEAVDQLIPEAAHVGGVFIEILHHVLEGRDHAPDAHDVLRARPAVPFLSAALDEGVEGEAGPAVEGAHAPGAVELVGREGEEVDVHLLHVDLHMARRLDRVRVEGDLRCPAHRADLLDGLDGADLVVGEHDGHEAGVGPDGRLHLVRGDDAVLVDGQVGDLIALLLEALERVEHGVVLEGGGDDVAFALGRAQAGAGADGVVVALAAAGGEVDLLGVRAQQRRHAAPGVTEGFLGPLPQLVEAGGVAPGVLGGLHHDLQGVGAQLGGGRVVSVDHCSFLSVSFSYSISV